MLGRAKRGLAPLRRAARAAHERKNNTYNSGLLAEIIVMLWLLLHGYLIMAWRFKTHLGEVDIVARRGRTIVAVEVKARKNPTGEEITTNQRRRIADAMQLFLLKNLRFMEYNVRYDAALVKLPLRVNYQENAW